MNRRIFMRNAYTLSEWWTSQGDGQGGYGGSPGRCSDREIEGHSALWKYSRFTPVQKRPTKMHSSPPCLSPCNGTTGNEPMALRSRLSVIPTTQPFAPTTTTTLPLQDCDCHETHSNALSFPVDASCWFFLATRLHIWNRANINHIDLDDFRVALPVYKPFFSSRFSFETQPSPWTRPEPFLRSLKEDSREDCRRRRLWAGVT
ncbi:hypothetical protein D9758_004732 [Tetrapyrgos nigripes]|uniref:Uncharacterized protein n=1 Tax=Tetrapyrgos nigripes TaxID=182062 RepID=A0A8H5H0I5_9AGAR|nr:hypothetical protein D9758_004732 [Tetrapyrgos nigripes]